MTAILIDNQSIAMVVEEQQGAWRIEEYDHEGKTDRDWVNPEHLKYVQVPETEFYLTVMHGRYISKLEAQYPPDTILEATGNRGEKFLLRVERHAYDMLARYYTADRYGGQGWWTNDLKYRVMPEHAWHIAVMRNRYVPSG